MPITISGDQVLSILIGVFALLGFVRGWQRMGIVFVGTLVAGIVMGSDGARLIRIINNLPKIVDLVLDTKYGVAPMVTDATQPYWMLGILGLVVIISWVFSNSTVKVKGTRLDWNKPWQAVAQTACSLGVGAGTGYLIVIRGYEYLLMLSTEQRQQLFQGLTIVLQPLPQANVLVRYESLLFLAMLLLAVGVIFGSRVYGSGVSRGKSDSHSNRD
jgi:hypothetical protein